MFQCSYPAKFSTGRSDGRVLVEFIDLPRVATKLEKLQTALAVLDKQITVEVRDAA